MGPIDGGNIGIELEWAESEADFKAGRHKTARLFLAPDAAEEFAVGLRQIRTPAPRGVDEAGGSACRSRRSGLRRLGPPTLELEIGGSMAAA